MGRVLKAAQQEMSTGSVNVQCQLSVLFPHFNASKKKVLYPAEWQIRWETSIQTILEFKVQCCFEQGRIRKDFSFSLKIKTKILIAEVDYQIFLTFTSAI